MSEIEVRHEREIWRNGVVIGLVFDQHGGGYIGVRAKDLDRGVRDGETCICVAPDCQSIDAAIAGLLREFRGLQ